MNDTPIVEVLGYQVTIGLPDWCADDRFEYRKNHYFDKWHAWPGSYSHTTYHNGLEDALGKIEHVEEICLRPLSCWITVKIDADVKNIRDAVRIIQSKVADVLKTWITYQPNDEAPS